MSDLTSEAELLAHKIAADLALAREEFCSQFNVSVVENTYGGGWTAKMRHPVGCGKSYTSAIDALMFHQPKFKKENVT